MPNRIAILVLGCVSPPYDQTIEAIRQTWGAQRVPGVDVFYVYGNPYDDDGRSVLARYVDGSPPAIADDAIRQIRDVLIVGCADHIQQQEDCLLRKRLRAYAYLAASGNYDLIYTVCATSYVDQPALVRYAATLISLRVVAGVVSLAAASRTPFVSGASMILSIEIARELGRDREAIIAANVFGHYDDVAVGYWIASQMSPVPLATFITDIKTRRPMTPDHIFVSCPKSTIDYVMSPAHEHQRVPHAFHYHFHSEKADEMVEFHRRNYEELT